MQRGERGWACTRGTDIQPCTPTALPAQPPATTRADDQHTEENQSLPPWMSHGPPRHQPGPTNSWLYVPLLHAGAARLHPRAEQAWDQDPRGNRDWQALVQHLREAAPVPWQHLHNTLTVLLQVAAHDGRQLSTFEADLPRVLATAAGPLPPATRIHLPWALSRMTDSSGYIPATGQEALLQTYLGERLAAAAATLADQWRRTRPAEPAEPPAHTTAPNRATPAPHTSNFDHHGPPDNSSTNSTNSTSNSSSSSSTSTTPRGDSPAPPNQPVVTTRPSRLPGLGTAWASLREVDLEATLKQQFWHYQSPPAFLRGRMRQALVFALEAILAAESPADKAQAWKLWMLLPRMLLHRQPGTRTIPKEAWRTRIAQFQNGEWIALLQQTNPQTAAAPNSVPTPAQQSHRACQLIHQGELSAARQALTARPLAPRTRDTLDELRDPARRPASQYQPIDQDLLNFTPPTALQVPATTIIRNLRRTRKGAAPGPSGLTAETLRILLDDEDSTNKFVQVAQQLAAANIPPPTATAIGLGRIVALQKPNGRVRGIVIGDILRRVVSRSIAQHFAAPIHQACSPHQFALSTRAGTEAIVHGITVATQTDPHLTVLSVDGIGAYDTISRNSMLRGLHAVPEANQCLPFVRLFYTDASQYVWHDATGEAHTITQAEGGEQGDPLMPALFALGQRSALQAVQEQLRPGEHLFVFLDDIYTLVQPARVRPVYDLLEQHLSATAHIQLHRGKARVWNASGVQPPYLASLGAEVWVGDQGLPAEEQGLIILGAPLGSDVFSSQHLNNLSATHQELLSRLPELQDLQASWLLLLFCASPRSNYILRMLPPPATTEFSTRHDAAVATCLTELLQSGPLPASALAIAHLPLSEGGLGLPAVTINANAAHWGSWADTLPVLQRQLPSLALTIT